MKERRTSRRRSLPYVRSAVLDVDGRGHIVVVTDISAEGAFLSARLKVEPGQSLVLKVILPRASREVAIPCQLIRRTERLEPWTGRPAGLAVRFEGLEGEARKLIEAFSAEGLAPAPEPLPTEHFEYRMLEPADVDVGELNRLGLDGWELASALSARGGVRLILFRRL
jgi:PilZ domain-containing protein